MFQHIFVSSEVKPSVHGVLSESRNCVALPTSSLVKENLREVACCWSIGLQSRSRGNSVTISTFVYKDV